jgi:anti-sigma factor RsiW
MTTPTTHPEELLDARLDGRLSDAERAELERHLAGCPRCRRRLEALAEARRLLRRELPDEAPPAGLEARVLAVLDREDAGASGSAPAPVADERAARRAGTGWLLPLAAVLVVGVVAAALWLGRGAPSGPGLVDDAFTAYAGLAAGELPQELRASDPGVVAARWRAGGIAFPARVFDLGGMGIDLAGGDASRLGGHPAARTVYAGGGGRFVCWMLRAGWAGLPPPAEIRHHGDFDFHVYRRGTTTLVLWQEGPILCAFAGAGDPESVIALAFAKAMAPPAGRT